MSISSQLPQVIVAARSGALQALALQAGQTLEGMVIGPAPNGGTQVQISGQMLNLVLPTLAKAGETLKFEVQGSGAQLRLALQPATVPSPTPAAPTVLPAPSQPATLPLPQVPAAAPAPAQTAVLQPAAVPTLAMSPNPSVPIAVRPPPAPALASPQVVASNTPTPSLPSAQPAVALPQPALQPTPAPALAIGTAPPPATPSAAPLVQSPAQLYQPAAPAVAAGPNQPSMPATVAPQATTPQAASAPGLAQPAPAAAVPAVPSTPQAALTQMVQLALPSQAPVSGLTTALAAIAGKVVLPEPVARAAQQVLAGRVNLSNGKIDAPALQRAIMTSGVFHEATLANGTSTPLIQPDMKSSLLILRQTLIAWLGQQAPTAAATHVAPPLRGSVPRARGAEAPPIDPAAPPEEVGKQLLERTDSALSRLRLHQHASLPEAAARAGGDWSMDLPVLIGTYQTILQLQIHRDQQGTAEGAGERGWQMRFAINLPGMGEVGAQVSLRGTATGVMLWATEPNTSEALEAEIVALRNDLAAAGLKPGAVIVRHGEPPAPAPAPSGRIVDART